MGRKSIVYCDGCNHQFEGNGTVVPEGWETDYFIGKTKYAHLCVGCITGVNASMERLFRERRNAQQAPPDQPTIQRSPRDCEG